jgi:hypothetical protein
MPRSANSCSSTVRPQSQRPLPPPTQSKNEDHTRFQKKIMKGSLQVEVG